MKASKDLIVTSNAKLYQGENAVENMVFYVFESLFDGIANLADYTATLYYTTPGNEAYMEILDKQEISNKDGYLQYQLPVTTKITKVAGDIEMQLVFSWNDEETNTQHVLKSGHLTITVDKFIDYFKYVSNDSLSSIENKIQELDAKASELHAIADEIQDNTPDDLILDEDILHLAKNKQKMGDGVEIIVPGDPDLEDSSRDGIVDLDELDQTDDDIDTENLMFVELSEG